MQERKDDNSLSTTDRFNNFRKRVGANTLKSINEMNKTYDNNRQKDVRFWEAKIGDDEISTVYLKFMPSRDYEKEGRDLLLIYKHWFQLSNGNWVITPCPHTIGQDCPICETRNDLYKDKENEDSQKMAASIKKNRVCVANVLILSDSVEPENNGKIFMWEFGKAIAELIETKMDPDKDKEETKFDVFNPFESGILKLKIKINKTPIAQGKEGKTKITKTRDYSGSSFIDPQNYNDQQKKWIINEERFEKLIQRCYSLENYLAELNVPTYEKCKEYFESKLNIGKKKGSLASSMMNNSDVEIKNRKIVEDEMENIAQEMPEDIKKALDADAELKSKMVNDMPVETIKVDPAVYEDDLFKE